MIQLQDFKKQFTANDLEIATTQDVIDEFGIVLPPPVTFKIRLADYFIYSTLDKGL